MNLNCPACNTEIKAATGLQLNSDVQNFSKCGSCKLIVVENIYSPEKHLFFRLGTFSLSCLTLFFILFTDNTKLFSASLIAMCAFIGLYKIIYLRSKQKWKAMA